MALSYIQQQNRTWITYLSSYYLNFPPITLTCQTRAAQSSRRMCGSVSPKIHHKLIQHPRFLPYYFPSERPHARSSNLSLCASLEGTHPLWHMLLQTYHAVTHKAWQSSAGWPWLAVVTPSRCVLCRAIFIFSALDAFFIVFIGCHPDLALSSGVSGGHGYVWDMLVISSCRAAWRNN